PPAGGDPGRRPVGFRAPLRPLSALLAPGCRGAARPQDPRSGRSLRRRPGSPDGSLPPPARLSGSPAHAVPPLAAQDRPGTHALHPTTAFGSQGASLGARGAAPGAIVAHARQTVPGR